MKNKILRWIMACLMVAFVSLGSVPTTYTFEALSLTDVSTRVASPSELVKFMKHHFEFTEDIELFGTVDRWQTPEEFLTRHAGDCEDYALFAQSLLQKMDYTAYVVSFYGPDYAHTVTIYEDGDKYNVINEDRLYTYQTDTIEEALTKVHAGWKWGALARLNGSRGAMIQKITNPAFSQKHKKKHRWFFF